MEIISLSCISDASEDACARIAEDAGVNLKDCYQCGKCTAGCPMVQGMDLMPREVLRFLQLGMADKVLDAKTPWICAQCEVCSTRCPQNVDITSVMRAVRHASKAAGKQPVPEADIFDDTLLSIVKSRGISNEQYLAAFFNLKSKHFMQDMGNAPKMLSRKLIGIKPHSIKGRSDVAEIFNRVLADDAAKRAQAAKGGDDK